MLSLSFTCFVFLASSGAPDARAAYAGFNSLLAAASSGLCWVLFDFIFTRKLSGLSLCTGIIAGLVAITPGSGFVAPWAALVIGFVCGLITNISCRLKVVFNYDDTVNDSVFCGSHHFVF
jgi:Amt family ammonium transporter